MCCKDYGSPSPLLHSVQDTEDEMAGLEITKKKAPKEIKPKEEAKETKPAKKVSAWALG